MSLLSSLAAGAGRAAADIATEGMKRDDQMKIDQARAQIERDKMEAAHALSMQQIGRQNELGIARDATRIQGEEGSKMRLADWENSPEQVERRAVAEGSIAAAKERYRVHNVSPGGQLYRDGEKIGENERPTGADLYEAGIRADRGSGASGSKKSTEFKAVDAWVKAQRDSGDANAELGGAIAETLVGQGLSERQAIARAQQSIDNAMRVAKEQGIEPSRALDRLRRHFIGGGPADDASPPAAATDKTEAPAPRAEAPLATAAEPQSQWSMYSDRFLRQAVASSQTPADLKAEFQAELDARAKRSSADTDARVMALRARGINPFNPVGQE